MTAAELLQILNTAIVFIGVPAIVGSLIFIGIKLHSLTVIEKSTEKIKHNMKVISDYLTRNHTKFNPAELQALSPLELTDIGRKFIADNQFEQIFKEHEEDFFTFIDEEGPKLKYDVEVAATKSIFVLADKPYMQFLKVLFYNNPNRNMENTAPTLGVYVRDAYLAKYPHITQ
ncbi:MAG: hypothetical protein P4M11_00665 [Candidatus Pacebacteria bacterium]|nr:hypothetical protein [Candidatus Paceibacterota bacterium]